MRGAAVLVHRQLGKHLPTIRYLSYSTLFSGTFGQGMGSQHFFKLLFWNKNFWEKQILFPISFIDETFLHSRSTVYLDSVRLTSKSKRSLNWTTPEEEVVVLGRLRLVEDREIRLNIRRLSLQTIGWYFNWKRTLYLPLLYFKTKTTYSSCKFKFVRKIGERFEKPAKENGGSGGIALWGQHRFFSQTPTHPEGQKTPFINLKHKLWRQLNIWIALVQDIHLMTKKICLHG